MPINAAKRSRPPFESPKRFMSLEFRAKGSVPSQNYEARPIDPVAAPETIGSALTSSALEYLAAQEDGYQIRTGGLALFAGSVSHLQAVDEQPPRIANRRIKNFLGLFPG